MFSLPCQSQLSGAPASHPMILPSDVLLEICRFLSTRADVLHFGLVSSFTFAGIAPALFSDITLGSLDQTLTTLRALIKQPHFSRHVRRLSISPMLKSQYSPSNSALASATVRDFASTKYLIGLTTFIWDDGEIPHYDDMWFSLRMGCPQLANIGVSMGDLLPSRTSHLYDFANLKGFSLNLTSEFFQHHGDRYLTDSTPNKHPLWAMLQRCTDLEELSILGSSPTPADAYGFTELHWPKLRRLHLGDVFVDWVPRQAQSVTSKRPFVSFLDAHPNLKNIAVSGHSVHHHHLATWEAQDSQVDTFQGTLPQLQSLPTEFCSQIKSLTFCEPLLTREVNGFTLAGVLQNLTSLRELRISFSLHCMYYDCSSLLRSLITGAPQLQHLELACLQRPSFQIESFSKTIRGFPKLRSLHLMIVKYPSDDSLTTGAARFARMNPRIQAFRLTHLSSQTNGIVPFHPKSVFSPSSSHFLETSRKDVSSLATASGSFGVTTDSFGLPMYLTAYVRSKCTWPWGLGESSKTQRYRSDLRPPGTVGTSGSDPLKLFFEKSPAGEEIRFLMFCGVLVFVAVFGWWNGIRCPH